jgi:large subunit ribosomal protein L29
LQAEELRQLEFEELRAKERELREELFRLRLKLATNQLNNPTRFRQARADLARVLTVMRAKNSSR